MKEFVDEQTGTTIYAGLNESVIHGTHRACDLIPALLDVIKDTPEYTQMVNLSNTDYMSFITDPSVSEWDERWDSEDVQYFLNEELFYVLDMYAPQGYYFGAHIGDGSDFGYWMTEEYAKFCETCEEADITDDGERWCYKDMRYREIEALIRENGLDYMFWSVDIPDWLKYKYVG